MRLSIMTLLRPWYRILGLARQPPKSWHLSRLHEEKQELDEAVTPLEKLSEESDVFFAIGSATHDGFPIDEQPHLTKSPRRALVYAYMLGKYTSRCAFYQTAAIICRAPRYREVREVINPRKNAKVRIVAERYGICPEKFEKVCSRLRRVWPLLP